MRQKNVNPTDLYLVGNFTCNSTLKHNMDYLFRERSSSCQANMIIRNIYCREDVSSCTCRYRQKQRTVIGPN
ncbi:hypothetical protein RRG08_006693 [Elysia crispata]|uniref:Uncharacterized protein n=1 Tax=Elysia crispata TaxID=231223 RepID=A0AAE0YVZ0_9GAST|nr:hypothetical protein RRG08_006693 [Elysia crispata]